jgi:hypothetical protein
VQLYVLTGSYRIIYPLSSRYRSLTKRCVFYHVWRKLPTINSLNWDAPNCHGPLVYDVSMLSPRCLSCTTLLHHTINYTFLLAFWIRGCPSLRMRSRRRASHAGQLKPAQCVTKPISGLSTPSILLGRLVRRVCEWMAVPLSTWVYLTHECWRLYFQLMCFI